MSTGLAYSLLDNQAEFTQTGAYYTGWDTRGHAFDSTLPHRHPVRLSVRQAMRGWQQLLRSMRVGEERA